MYVWCAVGRERQRDDIVKAGVHIAQGGESDGIEYRIVRGCRATLGCFNCARPVGHRGAHNAGMMATRLPGQVTECYVWSDRAPTDARDDDRPGPLRPKDAS